MSTTVFPQTGDPDYGELFALLLGQENTTDFVGRGLDITVDTADNTATIASGTCYIHIESATVPTTSKIVEDLGYVVQIDSQTIDLPHSGDNYIAVVPDYNESDTVSVNAYDITSNVPSTGLLIGSADPGDGTTTLLNRDPDVTADELTVVGSATVGTDLTVSGDIVVSGNLKSEDGTTIFGPDSDIPISALAANDVTIETSGDLTGGGTVELGGSVTLGTDVPVTSVFGRTGAVSPSDGDYTHAQIASLSQDDHHTYPVPNTGLVNDTVTVTANGDLTGGGEVSLGGSVSLSADLHEKYTDAEAVSAVDAKVTSAASSVSGLDSVVSTNQTDIGALESNKLDSSTYQPESDTHSRYTDSEAVSAVDGEVSAAGSSVSALDSAVSTNTSDISSLQSNKLDSSAYQPETDTHNRYTDSEAISAVDGEVSTAASSVSGLDSQVSTHGSDISSLQSNKLDASNYDPETDTHDRYSDSEAISAVDGEVSTAASSVSGLDSQVSTNSSSISSLQSNKLDTSNYDPESDTHSRYDDSEAISAVDSEVSATGNSVSALDSQASTNASDISSLQSNKLDATSYTPVSDVDGQVDAAATTVAALDDQVSTNVSDISSLQSNKLDSSSYTPISDVDSQVDAAATTVAGLDDQVSTNVSNISSLQSNKLDSSNYDPESDTHSRYADSEAVSAVDGQVDAAATTVAGLDDQVLTNESDITALENSLNNYDIEKNGTDGAGVINFKTQ